MVARIETSRLGPLIAGALLAMTAPGLAQNYTAEQEQLCSGDAFRLCSFEIPDVDRVTACMIRRQAELSPGCKSVFMLAPAAPATAPTASRKSTAAKRRQPDAAPDEKAKGY